MKFLKLYAAIFGALALFNGNLALKIKKATGDENLVKGNQEIQPEGGIRAQIVADSQAEPEKNLIDEVDKIGRIIKETEEEKNARVARMEEKKKEVAELEKEANLNKGDPSGDNGKVAANEGLFGTNLSSGGSGHEEHQETIKEVIFREMDNTHCFSDVGVNSEGIIIGVGLDSELYVYDFPNAIFVKLVTEYHISNLWRADINYDGVIYVITRCGDTYYLDCELRWVKLPGCAIDIGAGRSGEVYKLGCEENGSCGIPQIWGSETHHLSSSHVYKLICSCNCKCCDRRCKVFIKKHHYKICEPAEKRVCYWIRLPNDVIDFHGNEIKFTRIDTKITGFPIVTDGRSIWEFNGGDENRFSRFPIYTLFGFDTIKDIATDNDGNVFFSTKDKIYIVLDNFQAKIIKQANGQSMGASNISVGPYGMFSFTNQSYMYTTAIQSYNQLVPVSP